MKSHYNRTQKLLSLISLLFGVILSTNISAQDIIILKTGERIEAKIIEISDVEIRYREYIDPDGIIFHNGKR